MLSWHAYKHSAPTVGPTPSTATRVLPGTRGWQFLYSGSVVPSSCMAVGVGGDGAERNVRLRRALARPKPTCEDHRMIKRKDSRVPVR